MRVFAVAGFLRCALHIRLGGTLAGLAFSSLRAEHRRRVGHRQPCAPHVRFINADQAIPPTMIPARATAEQTIVPSRNLSFARGPAGGWTVAPIFGDGDVGRQMSLLLTVEVAGEPHEYRFHFNIGAPATNG